MGRFSDATLDLVRQRADIVTVIGERVALEKKGRDFVGRCPFHDEKTPSFYVNPEKQAWYCHGACKKGGDVFTFVREVERVRFPDAVRLVARRFGVTIEEETPEERARAQRKADLLDAMNRTVDFYKRRLWDGKDATAAKAREFLERRGVTEETARAFSLGVAPQGNLLARKAGEVGGMLRLLRELSLVIDGRDGPRDFFRNRLLFPIADEAGRWIAFGARRLDEQDEPKFLNSRDVPGVFEKKRVLYGLDRARQGRRPDRLVVVEGYMDVVIAHQAGATNVVAALSAGFTREHCSLAKRFADGIVLLFDGDAAGQTANRRVLEDLLELDLDARVASLPEKKDPDEFILERGKDAFDRLVREESRDLFQYLVDLAARKAPAGETTPALVQECARLLGKFKDDVRHQLSLRLVAERLRIPEDLLRKKAVEARAAVNGRKRPEDAPLELADVDEQVAAILGPHACAGEGFEVLLLEALLARPQAARTVAAEVHADDFTRGPLREVASVVLRIARDAAPEDTIGRVLEQTNDGVPAGIVSRLVARVHEHPDKNHEAELDGGVRALVARRSKTRADAIRTEIERASERGDGAELARLLAEKERLDRVRDDARARRTR